jgi:5-methylcytosine-specific restriction endonuclease McrA
MCRCCGRQTQLEHHHIQERSLLGADSTENIVLLCRRCHTAIQQNKLEIIGTDANRRLEFLWRWGGGTRARRAE